MNITLEETDRCVMCGMCLPHCPTYLKTRHEAESPRGRISLMRALHTGDLDPSDSLEHHLETCLSCRACEAVCPAGVPYGELADLARAELVNRRADHRTTLRLAGPVLRHRWLRRVLGLLMRIYQRSGLQVAARASGLLKRFGLERADSLLPKFTPARPLPVNGSPKRGIIGLFTGCVAENFDRDTLGSAKSVLELLGYEVLVPREQ